MANDEKQENKKVDWRKKGLGWIPDYPDLRDYKLGDKDNIQTVDGKLKKATAGNVEGFTEDIISILSSLNNKHLEGQINELEESLFGSIRFKTVRFYKFLREGLSVPESPYVASEKFPYKSILSDQILELKKYLSILVLKGYLPFKSPEFDLENPTQVQEWLAWLKKDEYDTDTKELVKLFQKRAGITDDGVVGLETYTTLNEYFSNSIKLKNLRNNAAKPPLIRTRLVSLPSLVPTRFLELILNVLKLRTIDQLRKRETVSEICQEFLKRYEEKKSEYANNEKIFKRVESNPEFTISSQLASEIFEHKFLDGVDLSQENRGFRNKEIAKFEVSRIFETIALDSLEKELMKAFNVVCKKAGSSKKDNEGLEKEFKVEIENAIFSFLNKELDACGLGDMSRFTRIFHNEFSVIEPIVSVVLKSLSPLNSYRNKPFEWIASEGIKNSEALFRRSIQLSKSTEAKDAKSISAMTGMIPAMTLEDLAGQALYNVVKEARKAIELILGEEKDLERRIQQKDSDFVATLCFYFLLKKFLNQFMTQDEQSLIAQTYEPNIFDKQELFEIEVCSNNVKRKEEPELGDQKSALTELFPIYELQIPISNSLIKSFSDRGLLKSDEPKPYIFLPSVVDLSSWCSEIEDQGALNSCTAFAGVALIEYFANRSSGKYTDASPLFLYKVARNLMNLTGDVGASVRETMKAMALFGVPPEEYWRYEEDKVDEEPPPFCYSFAQNYQALRYFRLDYAGIRREILLFQVKAVLSAGFPCMFGFTIYTSAYEAPNPERGYIPFPNYEKDRVVSGHSIVAVGYDDYKEIERTDRPKQPSRGAFLIRNSWGVNWGQGGYGWLPYDYVLAGLTANWWSLLKSEWFDKDSFGLGANSSGGTIPPPIGG